MAKAPVQIPLTVMIITGDLERIHMALMLGATAAAVGRPVTCFFSKRAVLFLKKDGWKTMQASGGVSGTDMDAALDAKGIADTELLLEGLSSLNARFVVCETAIKEHDIDVLDLVTRPQVEISGLADILEKGAGGDWMTF